MYDQLCWQLQISYDHDSTIVNCEYHLANIGCESFGSDINPVMDAYKILQVECARMLGKLPEMGSLQEVLRLKEKRPKDVHNLRQELSRIEHEIRNGGTQSAIEKA
jgi:hypothetical protein